MLFFFQIEGGFFVKHTRAVDETVDYLVMLTRTVMEKCQNKIVESGSENMLSFSFY